MPPMTYSSCWIFWWVCHEFISSAMYCSLIRPNLANFFTGQQDFWHLVKPCLCLEWFPYTPVSRVYQFFKFCSLQNLCKLSVNWTIFTMIQQIPINNNLVIEQYLSCKGRTRYVPLLTMGCMPVGRFVSFLAWQMYQGNSLFFCRAVDVGRDYPR